ncbi:hypothetical protein [Mesorhizobium sp.]|nr:hypothetical protein [Mesorhizobium sp.]
MPKQGSMIPKSGIRFFGKDHAQQKMEPHPDAIGMEQAPEQSNRKGQKE